MRLTYKKYRNVCNKLLFTLKSEYHSKQIEDTKHNPKKLWNTLKSIIHPSAHKNDPIKLANDTHNNTLNSLNHYFTTVGKNLSNTILNRLSATEQTLTNNHSLATPSINSFFFLPTDESEVDKYLSQIKSDSSPGPDGITARLLKKIRPFIAKPLSHIFNLSLSSGSFPDCWKIAAVTPIHKGGPVDIPENFRPIALLNILSKLLEKIVNRRLLNYLDKQNLISDRQFGFRKGKSTEDAAMLLTNSVASHIQNGEQALAVFIDLAKAFDTISPSLLIKKLESVGIRGLALDWFSSYLTNRKQYVKIDGIASEVLPIKFGVPQGSILGPTLFTLYINEIVNLPLNSAQIISYADDTAIIFHSNGWDEVYKLAESGLQTLAKALDRNLLTLNIKKTKLIAFSKTQASKPNQNLQVKFHTCNNPELNNCDQNCTIVERVKTIRYLGIILDENLSFKSHIETLSSRTRKLIYVMKKLRDCTPLPILTSVFHALCQSILQYGISVWGGAGITNFITVERAQRAVIKVMLRKPFRFPTADLYSEFAVLRVRQLFVLKAVLTTHRTLKIRKDFKKLTSRRTFSLPCPRASSLLAKRCPKFLFPRIYNSVNKHCNITLLSNYTCKKVIKKWLHTLSFEETEQLLKGPLS
ncbi:unnamed protein product [Colias eurytheme]|nr:unnamed protein product [Colias eurytheme]